METMGITTAETYNSYRKRTTYSGWKDKFECFITTTVITWETQGSYEDYVFVDKSIPPQYNEML